MNIKKTRVIVVLTRHKRKDHAQPWTVTIARPSREEYVMKQRYYDDSSARRGAKRNLRAEKLYVDGVWAYYWPDGRGNYHPIVYTVKRNK